ncbi:MAG: TetR family transcriptional regulator [Gammaproteobacteria bacterium]|nr:TetR family transcriptional regulator [Gammaproteobacteria bacterium]
MSRDWTKEQARDAILDAALALGERHGWDALHMHEIAETAGTDLAELGRYFDQKDALCEAWFDRADAALREAPHTPGWRHLTPRERLGRALLRWLDALAPHRRLTAAMLGYKLQPEHPHLQLLGLTRISRTVQWLREAALLESTGWRRELEEVALTGIYLATFLCWLGDESEGARRTRALLDRQLALAEKAALGLHGDPASGKAHSDAAAARTPPSSGRGEASGDAPDAVLH